MTLVDSSGWIEYFTDGQLADEFAPYLADLTDVVTPTIIIFEVYRVIRRQRAEEDALAAVAQIQKTKVVGLDEVLAVSAAEISVEYRLAMADAIVYATAVREAEDLVTADSDFDGLPGARVISRP